MVARLGITQVWLALVDIRSWQHFSRRQLPAHGKDQKHKHCKDNKHNKHKNPKKHPKKKQPPASLLVHAKQLVGPLGFFVPDKVLQVAGMTKPKFDIGYQPFSLIITVSGKVASSRTGAGVAYHGRRHSILTACSILSPSQPPYPPCMEYTHLESEMARLSHPISPGRGSSVPTK